MAEIERTLGHAFADRALLERALTHRSAGRKNYERLEFLGDGLLNFIIAEALYRRFADTQEGALSRLRADLVCQQTLAHVARALELGSAIRLGVGELNSGGRDRDSILADVLEALIGALYVDGGFQAAQSFVLRVFADGLSRADPESLRKDAKTRLQEWLQGRNLELPDYRVVEVHGEPHNQHFVVECIAGALRQPARGEGSSRRRAEQAAAQRVLQELGASDD